MPAIDDGKSDKYGTLWEVFKLLASKRSTNGIAVSRGAGLESAADGLCGLADDASAAADFEMGVGVLGQPAVG